MRTKSAPMTAKMPQKGRQGAQSDQKTCILEAPGPTFSGKAPDNEFLQNINIYNGLSTFRGSRGPHLSTQNRTLNPSGPRRPLWEAFSAFRVARGSPKSRKRTQKVGQRGPKGTQNAPQIGPKSAPGPPGVRKGSRGHPPGPKMSPKWSEIGRNCSQNGPEIDLKHSSMR